MAEKLDTSYPLVTTCKIGDRRYDLLKSKCATCGNDHYKIFRFCGPSFSCYRLPLDFNADDFEWFVQKVDQELLQSSADLLEDFRPELEKVNNAQGIDADFSRKFLLTEYARNRIVQLEKLGFLKTLQSRKAARTRADRAIRLAFELGAAVTEHAVMTNYEDYFWDGMAVQEWREAGLPRAREERLRQGMASRNAIVEAAIALYKSEPDLVRNDTATARRIRNLNLPDLSRGSGVQLGIDAITKHLRAARKAHHLLGKS